MLPSVSDFVDVNLVTTLGSAAAAEVEAEGPAFDSATGAMARGPQAASEAAAMVPTISMRRRRRVIGGSFGRIGVAVGCSRLTRRPSGNGSNTGQIFGP